mgnify:CR=1 FL=1
MIELPKIPSELLTIALRDMKATIAQGIDIEMDTWGSGNLENDPINECSVCFAGSVMLQTTVKSEELSNTHSSEANNKINEDQYNFLDSIRQGELAAALCHLKLDNEVEQEIDKYRRKKEYYLRDIPGWKEYSHCIYDEEFYDQIEDLIAYFKSIDL